MSKQIKYLSAKKRGFLLVEMLVYIGLLVIITLSTIFLMLSLRDLLDLYRADQEVFKNAQGALERMLYEIRGADAVNITDPDTVLIDSPGHLVLSQGTSTSEFSLENGAVMLTVNEEERGPLTQNDVVVDELRFFQYDNGTTEAVRVQITISAAVGEAESTATFNAAAVLLSSYD
ncbi:MAG: type II secretion system protein [Candidatus Paceibacterota bacterium]